MPNPEDLQITKEELGRQAVHSLRGYIYQLYQSLAAWLELKQDELLLLEVTEDFAKLSDNVIQRIQVGETKASGNITLLSEKVISLVESHWNMQNANPSKKIVSVLLTTSGIGKEKNCQFPDDMKGLDYWKIAAREGSDVEPIRTAFLQINLSQPVKDWIENTSANELRDKIIAPIQWVCYSEQLGVLQESIKESLANLGENFGISPTNAIATLDKLLGEVVQRILLEQNQRVLSRADLLIAFEDATRISVPTSSTSDAHLSSCNQTWAGNRHSLLRPVQSDKCRKQLEWRGGPIMSMHCGNNQQIRASCGSMAAMGWAKHCSPAWLQKEATVTGCL